MRNGSGVHKVYTFKCKKCGMEIKYERDESGGFLAMEVNNAIVKHEVKKTRVYLTCEKGHTYPYEIE